MRAVIYARISREDQSAYSLEEQVRECKSYIEKEKMELVNVYIDDGFSAKNMNRPQLTQMLADMRENKFDVFIIWRLDRLTRDTLDGLTMVNTIFKKYDVSFVSINEDIDTSTPDGYMMFTIRLSMAQNEREKIAQRVSMGQRARARSGKRNSSAKPYGYDVSEKDLSLTINEQEAPIMREIFDMYLKGYGKSKIAGILNERGIPAPRGGIWYEFIIGTLVRNRTYTGAVHWKPKGLPESERIVVDNCHEAIVSKEDFDQAQNIIERKQNNLMSQSSYTFAFSTILKCSLCGRSYHGKLKTFSDPSKKRYAYYRCSGKYREHVLCSASDISETVLLRLLFSMIAITIEKGIALNEPVASAKNVDVDKEKKRITKEMEKISSQRKEWAQKVVGGKMGDDAYIELTNTATARYKQLEKELGELPDQEPTKHNRKEIIDSLKNLRDTWHTLPPAEQKQLAQRLFQKIIIGKDNGEWYILGFEVNY